MDTIGTVCDTAYLVQPISWKTGRGKMELFCGSFALFTHRYCLTQFASRADMFAIDFSFCIIPREGGKPHFALLWGLLGLLRVLQGQRNSIFFRV